MYAYLKKTCRCERDTEVEFKSHPQHGNTSNFEHASAMARPSSPSSGGRRNGGRASAFSLSGLLRDTSAPAISMSSVGESSDNEISSPSSSGAGGGAQQRMATRTLSSPHRMQRSHKQSLQELFYSPLRCVCTHIKCMLALGLHIRT